MCIRDRYQRRVHGERSRTETLNFKGMDPPTQAKPEEAQDPQQIEANLVTKFEYMFRTDSLMRNPYLINRSTPALVFDLNLILNERNVANITGDRELVLRALEKCPHVKVDREHRTVTLRKTALMRTVSSKAEDAASLEKLCELVRQATAARGLKDSSYHFKNQGTTMRVVFEDEAEARELSIHLSGKGIPAKLETESLYPLFKENIKQQRKPFHTYSPYVPSAQGYVPGGMPPVYYYPGSYYQMAPWPAAGGYYDEQGAPRGGELGQQQEREHHHQQRDGGSPPSRGGGYHRGGRGGYSRGDHQHRDRGEGGQQFREGRGGRQHDSQGGERRRGGYVPREGGRGYYGQRYEGGGRGGYHREGGYQSRREAQYDQPAMVINDEHFPALHGGEEAKEEHYDGKSN
eukprot:TRINITY_DN17516_c0_g1_i1.p1 TRINITY_DN17516_c0_g1~~TRINITY_DN17516_c0_g1_i1.p1  ORF type:complete len:404 (+),score=108.81 TRINITY_DN17516_c0_g1_i1:65-1276(+)